MKKFKERYVIIAICQDGYPHCFSTFTNCCAYFRLPYHSLKAKSFPITATVPAEREAWAGEVLEIRKVMLWGNEAKNFDFPKK